METMEDVLEEMSNQLSELSELIGRVEVGEDKSFDRPTNGPTVANDY
jgi:hypothetical protein